MLGWVLFDYTDDALVLGDQPGQVQFDYCKRVSDRVPVPTTGSVLYNIGKGCYLIENNNASEDTLFGLSVIGSEADKNCPGMFTQDTSNILAIIQQLLSRVHPVGTVALPSTAGSDTLVFFQYTDYDDVTFTVSAEYLTYLLDPEYVPWFTMSKQPPTSLTAAPVPALDLQCTIVDAARGVISVDVPAAELDMSVGTYFWQLQLRKSTTTGNPPVTTVQRRMPLEGTAYVRRTFKI